MFLKQVGYLLDYLYNIDEPWGDAVKHAKKIYRLVKKRYGYNINVMQNTNQNNDRILGKFLNHFEAIDINLGFYNITELQNYRNKKKGIKKFISPLPFVGPILSKPSNIMLGVCVCPGFCNFF